jgi:hypothetical protein
LAGFEAVAAGGFAGDFGARINEPIFAGVEGQAFHLLCFAQADGVVHFGLAVFAAFGLEFFELAESVDAGADAALRLGGTPTGAAPLRFGISGIRPDRFAVLRVEAIGCVLSGRRHVFISSRYKSRYKSYHGEAKNRGVEGVVRIRESCFIARQAWRWRG